MADPSAFRLSTGPSENVLLQFGGIHEDVVSAYTEDLSIIFVSLPFK